jgi:transposase InsO family protein
MLISLHKQATTTPKIRAAIQASTDPAWLVAERYGISEQTVWKWRSRDDVHDRSHTPHRLQTTLTPPMRPQTNGMVERFNGRIEDVLQSHRLHSGEDLEQTILRYVHLYNGQLPQSALKGRTPIVALKDWQHQRPELFRKRVYNHADCEMRGVPQA